MSAASLCEHTRNHLRMSNKWLYFRIRLLPDPSSGMSRSPSVSLYTRKRPPTPKIGVADEAGYHSSSCASCSSILSRGTVLVELTAIRGCRLTTNATLRPEVGD